MAVTLRFMTTRMEGAQHAHQIHPLIAMTILTLTNQLQEKHMEELDWHTFQMIGDELN